MPKPSIHGYTLSICHYLMPSEELDLLIQTTPDNMITVVVNCFTYISKAQPDLTKVPVPVQLSILKRAYSQMKSYK